MTAAHKKGQRRVVLPFFYAVVPSLILILGSGLAFGHSLCIIKTCIVEAVSNCQT
jgi:hypothetical protein